MSRTVLIALASVLLVAGAGAAEPRSAVAKQQLAVYTVDWSTVDGGGGRSTGGAYVLTGTVAQADADPLQPSNGGAYQVDGGFWGGATPGNELFRDSFE